MYLSGFKPVSGRNRHTFKEGVLPLALGALRSPVVPVLPGIEHMMSIIFLFKDTNNRFF